MTFELFQKATILACCDIVRTQSQDPELNFVINHYFIEEQLVHICESDVRNCP